MVTKNPLLIDIGGTKTEIKYQGKKTKYDNKNYHSFEKILTDFQKNHFLNPDCLAMAAAGPVKNFSCQLTNLPWHIRIEDIKNSFFPYLSENNIFLLNDLEAFAWFPKNLLQEHKGTYVVISVGTGLGAAFAFYNKKHEEYFITPTEAGHTIFSMDNEIKHWEDFLSGKGLLDIYHSSSRGKTTISTTRELHSLATAGDRFAIKAIHLFFEKLGFFAQNIALLGNPEKGIFLSGGVISAFYDFNGEEIFKKSFYKNNKMHGILKEIPIHLIEKSGPIKGLESFISCN